MREERLNDVKKEIRSVIITYPNGVSLNGFLRTYQQLVGVRLPTREFGFTSDVDFLYSLTDVVKVIIDKNGEIHLNCIADENTEHIQKLVGKQRVVKTKPKNTLGRGHQEKAPVNSFKNKLFVSAALRKNLFEVLKDFPDGISYNSLLLAYQKKFKRPLNLDFLSESRFDRLRKLEMTVSELQVKVVDETERLFYCPLTRKKSNLKKQEDGNELSAQSISIQRDTFSAKAPPDKDESDEIPIIPRVIKEDFEKVLKLYPDGVLARYFPFLYEKMSGEIFDLADLGFNDFLELADALPDVFICIKLYENPNEWMVFHTCFAASAEKLKKLNEALALSDERFGQATETLKKELPSDITLQPYLPPEFPRDVNLSLYIPVFISAATNPGCFWFKLKIEEVVCRFTELEYHLQSFYHSESSDSYKMLSKDVKIGATCVAIHDDHWYRTTITSFPSPEIVNVYLVDYGSWEKVPCSKLRYLKNSFIRLPAQAFKALLASVKPINNSETWSKRATARFLQLSIKDCIMAQVCLQFNDSLSVFLCDTSGDDDIYINDILVDENLAESFSADSFHLTGRSSVTDFHNGDHTLRNNDTSANECVNSYADTQRFRMNGKDSNSSNSSSFTKRVYLGDGYWSNIIVISEVAYITVADLCHLFWHDKSAEVLKSRLQCKDLDVPTTTIFRDEQNDLFLRCENNGVHGFSSQQQSVELYQLSEVIKVLNSLGHPSMKVRQAILTAQKNQDSMNALLKESKNSLDANARRHQNSEDDLNSLCLYDLKAMHEAVKFKRLLLQKKYNQNPQTAIKNDLQKVETLQESIEKRIKDINSICSFFSRYE